MQLRSGKILLPPAPRVAPVPKAPAPRVPKPKMAIEPAKTPEPVPIQILENDNRLIQLSESTLGIELVMIKKPKEPLQLYYVDKTGKRLTDAEAFEQLVVPKPGEWSRNVRWLANYLRNLSTPAGYSPLKEA